MGPITGPNRGAREYIAIAVPLSSESHTSPSTPPPIYKRIEYLTRIRNVITVTIRTESGALPPTPERKRKAMS